MKNIAVTVDFTKKCFKTIGIVDRKMAFNLFLTLEPNLLKLSEPQFLYL